MGGRFPWTWIKYEQNQKSEPSTTTNRWWRYFNLYFRFFSSFCSLANVIYSIFLCRSLFFFNPPQCEDDNDQVNDIYWNCEQKCRKITQRSSYYVLFHTSSFIIVLIYALVCIVFGKYDTSSWYLSFYVVVPFDQTRVLGWLLTWLFQFLIAFSYSTSMTSITSYFASCSFYIYAMCDHSNVLIKAVEADVARLQVARNARKATEIQRQLQYKFGNMVEFQIKIYE